MLAKVAQSADTIKPNATFLQSKAIQNCGTGSRRRGLTGALGFLGEECLVRCFFFACLWREGLSATITTESVSASKASTAARATGGGGVVSLSLTTAVTSNNTTISANRTIVPRRSRLVMSKKPFFIVYSVQVVNACTKVAKIILQSSWILSLFSFCNNFQFIFHGKKSLVLEK